MYELTPLRRVDVETAAKDEGLSPQDFLKEVRQKDLVSLAIKPLTLRFLLNIYSQKGQFPQHQKRHELYFKGCEKLCEEVNPNRQAMNQLGSLDIKERIIVAARIAAITVFTNRTDIWKVDEGNVLAKGVLLQELCYRHENANGRQFDVTREVVDEVLDTGLFSSRGLQRMGWAHQTYAEFLAAWYLVEYEVPLAQIKRLIFSSKDSDGKLVPQLHETAAWLASMRADVLQAIIETDPYVLLQSDVPSDADIRSSIVDSLLKQHEEEKLFASSYRHYSKLSYPRLAAQLRPYLSDSRKQVNARELAIDIAKGCEVSGLQDELVSLALDPSQSIYLRVSATHALCSIGSTDTRAKLKPLATQPLTEDEDDRLKGYALQAVWSEHLSAKELFQALTPPKKRNFFGGYQSFLSHHLVPQLQPDDLVVALDWLEKQGVRCFGHPFRELGDDILLKAWEHFDLPGVAESFTKVALVRWRKYQQIITDDSKLEQQFTALLLHDSEKRRKLIKQAVLIISEIEGNPLSLLSSLARSIVIPEDIAWMLGCIEKADSEQEQKIWATLIRRMFQDPELMTEEAEAILEVSQISSILFDEFSYWTKTIDLDSAEAVKTYTAYLQEQVWQSYDQQHNLPLEPPPKERVLQCLDKLEIGNLSAWWQLNREMTLKSDSKDYGNGLELDLTKLPGWQEADKATRRRVIAGAKKYIQEQDDIDYQWIEGNTYRISVSPFKAFLLLLQESPNFIDNLSSEIWRKWSPVIIAVHSNNLSKDIHLKLIQYTYWGAPQETLNTLVKIIDKENKEYGQISILSRFDRCWDEKFKLTLLKKAKDPTLKPKVVGQLLEELLKREVIEARDFAESIVSLPLPSDQNEREKALIAAKVLIEHSDSSSWSFIWSLIQQDPSFGHEVFELVAIHYPFGTDFNLTEIQLSNLYLWLVRQYPYPKDPDHSNDIGAYNVTARDSMARLRDNVLSQLKEVGTHEACTEIQRLIQELPHLTWLRKTLVNAQANMRRKTWQPPMPEEILQLVLVSEPSNLEISSKIDEVNSGVKKMSEEPKINISDNSGSYINFNAAQNGIAEQKIELPSKEENNRLTRLGVKIGVVTLIIAVVSIFFNGLFNDEVKDWLTPDFSPEVEQEIDGTVD